MKALLILFSSLLPSFILTQESQEPTLTQRVQSIVQDIENLPKICNQSGSLYTKTTQLQSELNRIKLETEALEEVFITQLIPFDYHARKFFNTRVFLFYVNKINNNIDFSSDSTTLAQQIETLSSSFQHTYKFSFNQPETYSSEDYSNWARSLTQTFDCLSSTR